MDLVRWLTSPEEQKRRALAGPFEPSRQALYQDPELLAQQALLRRAGGRIRDGHPPSRQRCRWRLRCGEPGRGRHRPLGTAACRAAGTCSGLACGHPAPARPGPSAGRQLSVRALLLIAVRPARAEWPLPRWRWSAASCVSAWRQPRRPSPRSTSMVDFVASTSTSPVPLRADAGSLRAGRHEHRRRDPAAAEPDRRLRGGVDDDHRGAQEARRLHRALFPQRQPCDRASRHVDRPVAAALRGKTIGVRRGTTHDSYATATYGGVATIRRYADRDELFIDLALGRLDLDHRRRSGHPRCLPRHRARRRIRVRRPGAGGARSSLARARRSRFARATTSCVRP